MAAVRRIQKELQELIQSPISEVEISPEDDITHWKATIKNVQSPLYSKGFFNLSIKFPNEYPFKSPIIKFVTRMYHPNIDDEGSICLGILKSDAWKPATKMKAVLAAIVQLLIEPNPDDPLDASIADLFKKDRKQYDKNVMEYVIKYAA